MAPVHRAQRARAQGPELRADRRDHGGEHDVAARDARRRAQLGLPLHVDPRHRVHAARAARSRLRLGGVRVLRVHPRRARAATRPGSEASTSRSCTASAARPTSPSTRSTTSPGTRNSRPVRIGNGAYDQQQHDVWGMLLDSVAIAHAQRRSDRADRSGTASPGSSTPRSSVRPNPTRASGRCAASRSTSSRRR